MINPTRDEIEAEAYANLKASTHHSVRGLELAYLAGLNAERARASRPEAKGREMYVIMPGHESIAGTVVFDKSNLARYANEGEYIVVREVQPTTKQAESQCDHEWEWVRQGDGAIEACSKCCRDKVEQAKANDIDEEGDLTPQGHAFIERMARKAEANDIYPIQPPADDRSQASDEAFEEAANTWLDSQRGCGTMELLHWARSYGRGEAAAEIADLKRTVVYGIDLEMSLDKEIELLKTELAELKK